MCCDCDCDCCICAQSVETQWKKVRLLLEFGVWLYCHDFPKADAQHQLQCVINILLHMETEQADGEGKAH